MPLRSTRGAASTSFKRVKPTTPRAVPLVDLAQEVIKARVAKADGAGPLFPELPVRPSTGKRGGKLSQAFARPRREVLGEETDGELAYHCFRHTWRTAARRAKADTRTVHEMGGWSRDRDTDID
jgi:integrase